MRQRRVREFISVLVHSRSIERCRRHT